MNKTHLSIVSPVYRGEKMVHELVYRIKNSISPITDSFEIILINDCSPDDSWNEIIKECNVDKRIKGINLSRNFGQHKAIKAGLKYATGDWIVVMDCDLQDMPEEIPILYQKAQEGFDIVLAEREHRNDKYLKKLSSSLFNSVFSYLSGAKVNKKVANFGIYKHNVISVVNQIKENDAFFPFMVNYVGFKSTSIPVQHGNRLEGHSSYTLTKLLQLASATIISNTNKPLKLMVTLGSILSFLSIIVALYNVTAYLLGLITVAGFTTTVFSIWFIGGLLMMQMGILGIYIGKVFDQVKGRPLYVVMDEINIEN